MSIKPVDQFPGKVAPATPDNPFGTARNITIPGDGTGTPWESSILKDEWALQHAMLINAGMEPNGTPDSAENSQLFEAAKASIGNGANLLSNHNFLIASPDDSQPPPDATPRSYPPGFQIFSGVFANETTGITDLTYINGRVSFTAGDFYIPRANSKELENITEFVASVADFDGKPHTRGVSYALVGDEYRVTVGVDALEDVTANPTPLGSVKFEQGSVATGHEVGPITIGNLPDYTDIAYKSFDAMISGIPTASKIGDILSTGQTNWTANASVGAALSNGLFAKANEIHASDYITSSSPTKAEVLSAIQLAISNCDSSGGGKVFVSSELNYGYNRNDPSTFPDLSSTVNNVAIVDSSIGDTYTLPSRDGSQLRKLMYTPNQGDSLHDGNSEWLRAAWAPVRSLSNDANLAPVGDPSRTALDNYRASNFFCANGVAKWGVQQGGRSGASFTEDELTQFKIIMNDIPDYGITGLASAMTIEKNNGWFGFHTNPISYYDYKVRPGGSNATMSLRAADLNPSFRLTNESTLDRAELAVGSNLLELRSSQGAVYSSTQSGGSHVMSRKDAGDVSVTIKGTDYSRRLLVRSTDGALRVINSAGSSATMTHDDSGNLVITGSYSPFTGTHLFFSKDKIEEGLAVDLVGFEEVEFISYTPIIGLEDELTEIKEDIKPRLSGEDYESWVDRCTVGKVIKKSKEVVVGYNETVTKLNGTVALCETPESKVCAGVVERQIEMEGGYLTYVAAVGDNKTDKLHGFRTKGGFVAGDILCTDINGLLAKAPEGLSRSVVVFKAMSNPDEDGRCYGYFIG